MQTETLIIPRSLPKFRRRLSDSLSSLGTLPWQAWVACLGFPALFFLTVQKPLTQIGTIDPYVYASYINDFAKTVQRFGSTYYAARIAYIYPERGAVSLLGVEAGYYVSRFIALSVATASVFAIGWRYYGLATAVFVSAWLCFTPWLARSLTWTHYDGFSVVYLLLAGALLLVPVRWRLTGHTAAGAVFGLAVNCNLLLLVVGAAFVPGWLVINRDRGARWIIYAVLCLLAGLVVSFAASILILEAEFPGIGFASAATTLSTSFSLIEGGSREWFLPLAQILFRQGSEILLIPIVLFAFQVFVLLRRPALWRQSGNASFAFGALLYLAMTGLLASSMHYLGQPWLADLGYKIYFLPASVLVLIALAGEIETRLGSPSSLHVASVSVFSLWLLLPLVTSWANAAMIDISLVILVGAIFVGAVLFYAVWGGHEAVVMLCSILALSCIPIMDAAYFERDEENYSPNNQLIYGSLVGSSAERQREWDVYHGAIFLQQTINASVPNVRTVGFWYSNRQALLRAVQSIFLWQYTIVAPISLDDPGMPVLDETTRSNMLENNYLVLLGSTEEEISNGLAAIRGARLPFQFVRQVRYQGQTWGFEIVLLKAFPQKLGAKLFDVRVSSLQQANGGRAAKVSGGIRLITGPQQYGYHLMGPLKEGESWTGKGIVRVELEIEEGEVGVAIEHSQESSQLSEVRI